MNRSSNSIATEIANLLLERDVRAEVVDRGHGRQPAISQWGRLYQLLLEYEAQQTRELIRPSSHSSDCRCIDCGDAENQLNASRQ
jgi:hypothetical protein